MKAKEEKAADLTQSGDVVGALCTGGRGEKRRCVRDSQGTYMYRGIPRPW